MTKVITESPLVSVVVPLYNNEDFIGETLACIFNQTYKNTEIILVDDGSTDNTYDRVAKHLDRVTYVKQKNSGPAAARNRGVSKSSGKYVAFLDSDDLWTFDHLALSVDFLEKNEVFSAVFSNFERFYKGEDGSFTQVCLTATSDDSNKNSFDVLGYVYHLILFNSLVSIITAVVRRSLYDELGGFREDLPRGEDYDFWIRASRRTPFARFKQVQAYYRRHGTSITSKFAERDYFFEVVKNTVDRFGLVGPDGTVVDEKKMRKHFAQMKFSHGYGHFYKANPRVAMRAFALSVKYDPLRIKSWIYLVMSSCKAVYMRARQSNE